MLELAKQLPERKRRQAALQSKSGCSSNEKATA
jgi:hypothetical protein